MSEYHKVIQSIPNDRSSNIVFLENEGATPNWQLDMLSRDEIRSVLEKELGIKEKIKNDDKSDWIFTIKIPESNLHVTLHKHHVRKTLGKGISMKIIKLAPIYEVILINRDTYLFEWRVYNLLETYNRMKYWIEKFTGVSENEDEWNVRLEKFLTSCK